MSAPHQRIDWESVKSRLQACQTFFEQTPATDSRHMEEVFRTRAAQLAARDTQSARNGSGTSMLVCLLGNERYGIAATEIAEVVPLSKYTPIPQAPRGLIGVVNVRGRICSIVDLAQLLGLPEAESTAGGYAVLLQDNELNVGLRVEQVEAITSIVEDEIEPAVPCGKLPSGYLRGLAPGQIIVLDLKPIAAAIGSYAEC